MQSSFDVSKFSFLNPLVPSAVFGSYLHFAAERQQILLRRLRGEPGPWTDDSILRAYKFTNAYRASDRVSQYLIKHVIYSGPQEAREVFFRTLLFKLFNRIETWEALVGTLGEISWKTFSFDCYDAFFTSLMERGERLYSAAYIMPSGGGRYKRKHRMHLDLLERMIRDELPQRLCDMYSLQEAFNALRTYPTLGPFLAFQFAIDLNYGTMTNFSESEFVVPGPGARDGIRKCFLSLGGVSEATAISIVAEAQENCFRAVELSFPTLWGRRLQLIDCQNLFCEISKYARVAHPEVAGISGRTKIKQRFDPRKDVPNHWYPPKWGINLRLHQAPECIPARMKPPV